MAGTALLGTVLVGLLIANARITRASAAARSRITACRIADELLRQWWEDRASLPRTSEGDVPERPGWTWRTEVIESPEADKMDAQVVAMEVFAPDAPAQDPSVRAEILLARFD